MKSTRPGIIKSDSTSDISITLETGTDPRYPAYQVKINNPPIRGMGETIPIALKNLKEEINSYHRLLFDIDLPNSWEESKAFLQDIIDLKY